MTKPPLDRIILASGNPGKLREFGRILQPLNIELIAQDHLQVPAAAETGMTFVENALLKARNAAKHTGLPALADDSGIVVAALDGAPGIRSARYAGENATDAENTSRLLQDLADIPAEKRNAKYVCLLVLVRHFADPLPLIAEGMWQGIVLDHLQGDGGFGYDPIFYLTEKCCTVAELSAAEKDSLSHRGKAIVKLQQQLREHL